MINDKIDSYLYFDEHGDIVVKEKKYLLDDEDHLDEYYLLAEMCTEIGYERPYEYEAVCEITIFRYARN